MKRLEDTIHDIYKWGEDRKIDTGGTLYGQLEKLDEEMQELWSSCHPSYKVDSLDVHDAKDAIGDIFVVLCMICLVNGWYIEECIEQAYNEIKDRKGTMIEGVFHKEVEA